MAGKYEDLKNLSMQTAKLRTFLVRVVSLELLEYEFTMRGGVQPAKKLVYDPVGDNEKMYVRGCSRCKLKTLAL